jgi:murein DD-endopeptidase MepM/ murein hydrolase activator NlpD
LQKISRHWLEQAHAFSRRHPRAIPATVVIALAGFAVTAFSVAPLAPDAALLPQTVITQAVVSQGLDAQLEALASHELALSRSDVTRSTDSAESLLARLGVADRSAAQFLRTDATARKLLAGRGGKLVLAQTDAEGALVELVGRYPAERSELAKSHFTRLTLSRVGGQWLARLEVAPLSTQVRMGSGTIRSSLFNATDEARLPDGVAAQIAEIFAADLDFHRELRKGDTFSVVYEVLTADGEPAPWADGAGRVLAAEFVNGGKSHQAMWFSGSNGKGGYFGIDGTSKRRAFLASPMEFSRVTSGFAMRFHPLMQRWRAHLGVDYGAPVGTAVRAVGDGTVGFAGWQNGYGNLVEIDHGAGRSTLYAHLSRIDVKKGQRIDQSQKLGAVGMTGWTTGPHLHFEFRVNGQHQDPLVMARASEPVTLDPGARAKFADAARIVKTKLDIAESMVGVRGQFE